MIKIADYSFKWNTRKGEFIKSSKKLKVVEFDEELIVSDDARTNFLKSINLYFINSTMN